MHRKHGQEVEQELGAQVALGDLDNIAHPRVGVLRLKVKEEL